jgi:hypothetical protein
VIEQFLDEKCPFVIASTGAVIMPVVDKAVAERMARVRIDARVVTFQVPAVQRVEHLVVDLDACGARGWEPRCFRSVVDVNVELRRDRVELVGVDVRVGQLARRRWCPRAPAWRPVRFRLLRRSSGPCRRRTR